MERGRTDSKAELASMPSMNALDASGCVGPCTSALQHAADWAGGAVVTTWG
jgi:hypothetical protein